MKSDFFGHKEPWKKVKNYLSVIYLGENFK